MITGVNCNSNQCISRQSCYAHLKRCLFSMPVIFCNNSLVFFATIGQCFVVTVGWYCVGCGSGSGSGSLYALRRSKNCTPSSLLQPPWSLRERQCVSAGISIFMSDWCFWPKKFLCVSDQTWKRKVCVKPLCSCLPRKLKVFLRKHGGKFWRKFWHKNAIRRRFVVTPFWRSSLGLGVGESFLIGQGAWAFSSVLRSGISTINSNT